MGDGKKWRDLEKDDWEKGGKGEKAGGGVMEKGRKGSELKDGRPAGRGWYSH